MRYLFLDFESFYSKDYSLRKMSPAEYILHPLFDAHCLGVADGFTAAPYLIDGPDIAKFLKNTGTKDVAAVSHSTLFDASILAWRFGWVPELLVDTLSMSRTLLSHRLRRHSLEKVSEYLGLKVKGDILNKVRGMTRADIIANGLWPEYTEYCMDDAARCRGIFCKLAPHLPPEEFILHDMILRCAVEPQFRANLGVLQENLARVQENKQHLLVKAMHAGLNDPGQLRSNPQFAELLKTVGVEPPTKISERTQKTTWSFSKSDPKFLALLEHDDPRVAALMEARFAFKTSIEETRSQRMLNIAQLEFGDKGSGWMPIPLKIGAAKTQRLGGDWLLNAQNWGRKSRIRHAVEAPAGYKVVAADSAQIEARMTAWFCGQHDLVEAFRQGIDVYADFAQDIYGVVVTKEREPTKRFVGKTGILQCGYQAWWPKFQLTVWLLSYNSEPEPIALSDEEAERIVIGYRNKYSAIRSMWSRLGTYIHRMEQPGKGPETFYQLGPITIGRQRVIGPGGLQMQYHNLHCIDGSEWVYESGGGAQHKLYGGKFLENNIQFLSRIAVMQAAVRLRKKLLPYGCRLTHTSHDELDYIVRNDLVGTVSPIIQSEMSASPSWAPDLPLRADIGVGQSYGECK